MILIKSKYLIEEGIVEKVFYDEKSRQSKVTINGFKGSATSSNRFSIGQRVYVVHNNNNVIMCYDKDRYYRENRKL